MKLQLSPDAQKMVVIPWNLNQVAAFVCDSRKNDATIVEVHIGYDIARRRARMIGGCMRVGRVSEDRLHGETM